MTTQAVGQHEGNLDVETLASVLVFYVFTTGRA